MSSSTRLANLRAPLGLAAALTFAMGASMPALVLAQGAQPAAPTNQQPAQPRPQRPAQQATPPAAAPQMPAQPGGAQAQGQQNTGPTIVQVKPEPSQNDWTKVCGQDKPNNTEICYTTREFVSDQGQPVMAVAVYDIKGPQPQKVMRFLMPLGLLLQPGIRFAVDQGQATPGRFAICLPNGCFAEAPVKDDFIAALKKGTTLNVSVQNHLTREVTFAVPVAGFAKGFDGAPIDPKVLEEQQKKLQEELEKRSEELRKRLESNAAGGAAAPAAPKQ